MRGLNAPMVDYMLHHSGKLLQTALAFTAVIVLSCSGGGYRPASNPQPSTIGIPVRSVNWVRLHEGRDSSGKPEILSTMGQNGENLFMLRIDPQTGEFRQYTVDVPNANYPTATYMSRSGKLYIGAAYAGHLLCYDPATETLDALGAISPENASFPCAIDEDRNGVIWIGSYGACDLTSYDPRTKAFTRHGRMDDTDMYNYPVVNADGTICCRIMMTMPHLVVFDPRTGEKRTVGPVTTKNEDTFSLVRDSGGRVHIASSKGNFRIEGFKAIPLETVPPAETKPSTSGMSMSFTDGGQQLYRTLEVRLADGSTGTYTLDYDAAGNDIFCLHRGPDNLVYGSSILPEHLFRYNPGTGALDDLGKCSAATGEAYSMANLDSVIYISSYPGARLSAYNPSKPYRYGDDADANPRERGRIDDISYRPRSTLAGPLGRVWLASVPDYGVWGGPLSWYDPANGEKKAYYRIAGDGSCYTLAHLESEQLIAVGTSISGGSGTQPKIDRASLILWDYTAEEKAWEGAPDRVSSAFNALCATAEGLLVGTITGGDGPGLFVFDPGKRTFSDIMTLPGGNPLDNGLQEGPDGYVYGFTAGCLYRFDVSARELTAVYSGEDAFEVAGPIVGNDIYFAEGHLLKSMRIFE